MPDQILKLRALLGNDVPGRRERKSLSEDAADSLRNLILLEKLEPGAAIPEREVAEALGISRTPMREAMRLLEMEGLVEYSATRRPRVANPSLIELTHYLMVLGALEALAGECASVNATEEETDQINALNRQMMETSDTAQPLEFFKSDMEFHLTIVGASRNPPLIETHCQYNALLWRARFISSQRRPNRARTLKQHDEIAAAITARDAKASALALRGHLETAVVNITTALHERAQKDKG